MNTACTNLAVGAPSSSTSDTILVYTLSSSSASTSMNILAPSGASACGTHVSLSGNSSSLVFVCPGTASASLVYGTAVVPPVAASPSPAPVVPVAASPVAASPSPAPGTTLIRAALVFVGPPLSAYANPLTISDLAISIASAIILSVGPSANGTAVYVTRITNVATSTLIYDVAGSRRRRLQAASVKVDYTVILPASASSAAANVTSTVTGTSASFAAAVFNAVVAQTAVSGNSALSMGLQTPSVVAATTLASSAPGSSSSSTPSPVGAAVGGAIGGLALLLLIFFAYRAFTRRNAVPIASDAGADGNGTAAAEGQFSGSNPAKRSPRVAPSV